jgi:hypothetical protein
MAFQNIFVLCTGRCGSTTIIRAMEHATNYSAGHETRKHCIGPERLAYPTNHFEADNRLSWYLGRLDAAYGTAPLYVHLTRDVDAVVRSFAERTEVGILHAYRNDILQGPKRVMKKLRVNDVARDMIDTVTVNIKHFLRDKPNTMNFRLENAETDFPILWERIGATGDLDRAMAEWGTRHNATVSTPTSPPQANASPVVKQPNS